MPRVAIDYAKSIIYKLCCNDTSITDCYIGSTTDLIRRKAQHKSKCNNTTGPNYNINVYKFIREHGEWPNWSLVVIEEYVAHNKNDLHSRERYWMEQLKPSLNKNVPTRTHQEYRDDNKDEIKQRQKKYDAEHKNEKKQYNADHKEEIALKGNKKVNCLCGGKYTVGQKSTHFKSKKHQASLIQILPNPSTEPVQEPASEPDEPLGGHSIIY
jgi:group I intron endonuclease